MRTSFFDFVIIEKPQPKASVNICDIITQCIQIGIYQTFNAARSVKCGAAFQTVTQKLHGWNTTHELSGYIFRSRLTNRTHRKRHQHSI